jgi:hypothetical protein
MKKLLVLLLFVGIVSCEKKEIESINCDIFMDGLSSLNETIVKAEIEKLTVDLSPLPSSEDILGHSGNLQTLIDRLNSGCETYTASMLCYACAYTYPAQSKILIEFFVGGNKQSVTIDIHTPENDILRFAGIEK